MGLNANLKLKNSSTVLSVTNTTHKIALKGYYEDITIL